MEDPLGTERTLFNQQTSPHNSSSLFFFLHINLSTPNLHFFPPSIQIRMTLPNHKQSKVEIEFRIG